MFSGFNQIRIDNESVPLFAFPIYESKYKGRTLAYKRLIFGWASAPAIFSATMAKIFHKIESKDCAAALAGYIDDLAYACKTWKDQMLFTRRFLARCRAFGVLLSIKKCLFAAMSVPFCGHEVSRKGVSVSSKRVSILKTYPDFDVRSRKTCRKIYVNKTTSTINHVKHTHVTMPW